MAKGVNTKKNTVRKKYRVTDKSLGVTLMGSFGAIVLTDKLSQAKLREIYLTGSKAVVYE